MERSWLDWVRRLQAVAQNGLLYTDSPFDRERYEALRDIAAEIGATDGVTAEQLAATFGRGGVLRRRRIAAALDPARGSADSDGLRARA